MQIDNLKLKEVAEKNATAKTLFNVFAGRERMRHTTNIARLRMVLMRQGSHIVDKDYLETFHDLEKMGVGSIVYGRKKKPTEFKWNYNLKEVGQAASPSISTEPPKAGIEDAGQVQKPVLGEIIKKRVGRPKGSKSKNRKVQPKAPTQAPTSGITAIVRRGDVSVKVSFENNQKLIDFINTLKS